MKKSIVYILIFNIVFFIGILFFLISLNFVDTMPIEILISSFFETKKLYNVLLVIKNLLGIVGCLLFFILTFQLLTQKIINFKKLKILFFKLLSDILHTRISTKTLVWSCCCFLLSIISLYNDYFRLSLTILGFCLLFLLREVEFVKNWLEIQKKQDLKLHNLVWEKYKFFCIFNSSIKFSCFIYFFYFVFSSSIFSYSNLLLALETSSIEGNLDQFSKFLEPLYTVLLLFINSVMMDFVMDLFIMFTEQDQLILSGSQLVRRASRTVARGVVGGGLVSSLISISPAVELPGVNESQIYLGRGYGYKTQLDWLNGTIMNRYIDQQDMQKLAKNYGNNNILDGHSFKQILTNEKGITKLLKENATPWEQRSLGIRTY